MVWQERRKREENNWKLIRSEGNRRDWTGDTKIEDSCNIEKISGG